MKRGIRTTAATTIAMGSNDVQVRHRVGYNGESVSTDKNDKEEKVHAVSGLLQRKLTISVSIRSVLVLSLFLFFGSLVPRDKRQLDSTTLTLATIPDTVQSLASASASSLLQATSEIMEGAPYSEDKNQNLRAVNTPQENQQQKSSDDENQCALRTKNDNSSKQSLELKNWRYRAELPGLRQVSLLCSLMNFCFICLSSKFFLGGIWMAPSSLRPYPGVSESPKICARESFCRPFCIPSITCKQLIFHFRLLLSTSVISTVSLQHVQ